MSRTIAILCFALAPLTPAAAAETETTFSQAQLEEMVAPIALYPDEVLSTVCIAATYPLEVVEADRWREKNAALEGEALDKALEQQDWDASVKSLVNFPDVLHRMSDNLEWTKDLGDAFLGQRTELMDAAQRLRVKAEAAGTLESTPQQTVVREKDVVYIQPTDPQVVYVPTYAPATVYGQSYVAPATPSYPSFWATPGGAVTAGVVGFGAGIATSALIGSAFDWGGHDVYVHNYYGGGGGGGGKWNRNVNVNVNRDVNRTRIRADSQKWQFKPDHRRGVRHRDDATAKRYQGRERLASASRPHRDDVRGFDRAAGGPAGGKHLDRPGGGQFAKRPGAQPGTRPDRPGGGGAAHRPGGVAAHRSDLPGGAARPAHHDRPQQMAGRPATRSSGRPHGAFADAARGHGSIDASRRGAASRGVHSRAGSGAFRGGGGHGGAIAGGGGRRGGGAGFAGGGRRGGGGRGGGGGGRSGGGGGRGGRRR